MSGIPFPTSGITRLDFCRESSKLTKISIVKKFKKKAMCLYTIYRFTMTMKCVKVYKSI